MDENFLRKYERELAFVRKLGAEFGEKYPNIAGQLRLFPNRSDDPHTERLIEAFALIAARIHQKIDDDFPRLCEAIMQIVYPQYNKPVPSMTIVQFKHNSVSDVGIPIKRDKPIYSRLYRGISYIFKTSYPVTLWPMSIVQTEISDPDYEVLNARQVISIKLKTNSEQIHFSQLGLKKNKKENKKIKWDSLRFFLNGSDQYVYRIYELIINHVCKIEYKLYLNNNETQTISLSPDSLKLIGFDDSEVLLPSIKRSMPGYQSLFELMWFPQKYLFFDLIGFNNIKEKGNILDINLYIDTYPQNMPINDENIFCLNVTPAVNLFDQEAESVRNYHKKVEYEIIPDVYKQDTTEIYSVNNVYASFPNQDNKNYEIKPLYSVCHFSDDNLPVYPDVFWHVRREKSDNILKEQSDVYLTFTDIHNQTVDPDTNVLNVHLTCSNGNFPSQLPIRINSNDIYEDINSDFNSDIAEIQSIDCLIVPTKSFNTFYNQELQWRLISHLSLNYISLYNEGLEALKQILYLYDFKTSPVNRQMINGITALKSEIITRKVKVDKKWLFCRGVKVIVTFDESMYSGTSLILFASVLEKFFGQYVSLNSFSQMVAIDRNKEVIKEWPPRNGQQVLL